MLLILKIKKKLKVTECLRCVATIWKATFVIAPAAHMAHQFPFTKDHPINCSYSHRKEFDDPAKLQYNLSMLDLSGWLLPDKLRQTARRKALTRWWGTMQRNEYAQAFLNSLMTCRRWNTRNCQNWVFQIWKRADHGHYLLQQEWLIPTSCS